MNAVIQYIKTFSEDWQDPDSELGEQVVPEDDPWEDDVSGAIERGNAVYHGMGTCQSCQPIVDYQLRGRGRREEP